jgi:hypothetical protein
LRHVCPRRLGPAFAGGLGVIALAVSASAIAVGLAAGTGDSTNVPPAGALSDPPLRLDDTSIAEARRMRHATALLSRELTLASHCSPHQSAAAYAECVTPALRHAGMGGRSTAMLVRALTASIPAGPCREYLLGLEAANDAAGDQARWLLPQLYGPQRRARQSEVATQLAIAASVLRKAARAAGPDKCSGAGARRSDLYL